MQVLNLGSRVPRPKAYRLFDAAGAALDGRQSIERK
jgi:hypothetical protein